jgi:hypothetical protein
LIGEQVVAFYEARPFQPFELRLQGGFVVPVPHRDFMVIEFAVLTIAVLDEEGNREVIDVDKIVSIKTLHPVVTF